MMTWTLILHDLGQNTLGNGLEASVYTKRWPRSKLLGGNVGFTDPKTCNELF